MGLALIAAVLEKEGHQVTVLEANALQLKAEDVPPLVAADVVGLTAMTPSINAAIAIAGHLKKAYPDLPIMLGGAHATLLPEETLVAAPAIDIIVKGEGEETVVELLQALEHKQPLIKVPGISYRKDGGLLSNPLRSQGIDLDSLPFLGYHLLPWQKYKPHPPHGRVLPFAAIITSRGCPYRCSYCSKPVFGTLFRGQSPERVIEEVIYHQKEFGIKEFAFYDDVFTLDKERTHAIADEIIKRKLKIYWTCETRVNLVDKELLRHIRQAGCYSIAYGIESGSQEIMETLDKGINLEQAELAVRLSRDVGLQTIGYFMVGSPGESRETIDKTIQFAKKLKLDFTQFAVTTPFPGTSLYDLYMKDRVGILPWEDFVYQGAGTSITPVFESSSLSRADLQYWVKRAYKEFYLRPSYIWQRIRQLNSWGDIQVNLKGLFMLLRSIS